MKKKIILSVVIVAALSLAVSIGVLAEKIIDADILKIFNAAKEVNEGEKTVIAIVNGKEIYQETIDFLAFGEELSQKNTTSLITSSDNKDASKEKDEILQKQIRNAVVLSEAERLGLTASYSDAEKYTKENYELVKQIGGDTYKIIKDYMQEMGLTEEEYLKKSTETNRKMLTRANLYDNFVKEKTGTNEELLTAYEEYVNKLIENAEIEYKK